MRDEEDSMIMDPGAGVVPATRPNAMTVDLDAVMHNVRELKTQAGDGVTFVAALKANAYGFGLQAVADAVLAAGAEILAVASVDDALAIRGSGITAPIMLYGGTRPNPQVIADVAAHDMIVTVLDEADVVAYGSAATTVRAMVKVDVGLERLGVEPAAAAALVRRLVSEPRLELAGMYTHLHVPRGTMTDISAYVDWQYRRFVDVLTEVDDDGIDVPLRIAASSGSIRLSEGMTLNGVDVGSLLFGLEPPGPSDRDLGLRQALVGVTSRLTQARPRVRTEFPDQSPIPTERPILLGVVPFGATDGFLGLSAGQVLVRGRRAPVLSISLEHARLDLTGIDDAEAGDEVVILGRQGAEEITMREVAAANGLYSPAVVPVLVGRGVPRIYLGRPG